MEGMHKHAKTIAALLLLIVAADAWASEQAPSRGAPEEAQTCVLPGERGGTVELILKGVAWRGWDALCRELIQYIRPGRPPWTEETADRTERLLEETGYFTEAGCVVGGNAVEMTCSLGAARIVQGVAFGGDVPAAVLREDLRRRVFLRPGTLLGPDEREVLERQRRRLEGFLRREGYFGAVVRIRPEDVGDVPPNQGVRLDAEVMRGRAVTLRNVEIHGDSPLDRSEIESLLTHKWFLWWFPRRFRPLQFEEDLDDIARLFYERGYPEARVTGDWRLDLPNEAVDLILRIEPGPRLVLNFEGNRHLGRRRLEKLVTFQEAGIVDPVEMEETAEAIRIRYQQAGYADCRVEVRHEEPGDGTLRVTYLIEEGERSHIAKVVFSGNERFSDKEIGDQVNLRTRARGLFGGGHWVDIWAQADRRAIEAFYRERGHAAARVSVEKRELSGGEIEARFEIVEGPPRTVRRLSIDGLPKEIGYEDLKERLRLKEGRPFVEAEVGRDYREILSSLAAHGYTRAEVKQDVERPEPTAGGTVSIEYSLSPGPKSRLGGVLVRGNFRTKAGLIKDQLELRPGDDLDLVALGQARRRLRALGPFSSVDLVPLDAWRGEEETWLLVELQERDARTLDGVLTFSTEDRLTAGLDYRDRNLLGRAIRLDLRLRLGRVVGEIHPTLAFLGYADKVDGQLRAPRPLGLPFDVEASAYYTNEDKPAYAEERLGIGAGAVREIGSRSACSWCPDVIGSLRYEVSAGTFEDRRQTVDALEDASAPSGRADVGKLVPGITLDRRDGFVDPMRGYAADLRLEIANDVLSPLGEGYNFLRLVAGTQVFVRTGTPFRRRLRGDRYLGGPLVLAGAASFGGARPYGSSTELPDSETFFYGGDYSVRGLSSRASRVALPGAAFMFVANLEARWYLLEGFGFGSVQAAAFADLGTVSLSPEGLFDEITLSVGPALRYVTPVGPISVSWGIPIMLPDGIAADMSDTARRLGRLHLTFGYTF